MRIFFIAIIILIIMEGCLNNRRNVTDEKDVESTIIALEKEALEQWNKGNPDYYLNLYSSDMTYFDPFFEQKLVGYKQMENYYNSIRGQVKVYKYEMINPTVQVTNDTAVLTFNLISYCEEDIYKWNCTEVYHLDDNNQWKIIHNHWSFIKPLDLEPIS